MVGSVARSTPVTWPKAWIKSHAVRAVIFAFMLWAPCASAQQDVRAVRSAYVYNLTKYVSWPQSKRTLLIAVVGDPGTGAAVKAMLDGKTSDGRTIQVVTNPTDSVLSTCDVVYVASTEATTPGRILPLISERPILTVGEDNRFVTRGGMVGLIRSADRIEVAVNLQTVRAAGLKMSSRLLNLATVVSNKEALR